MASTATSQSATFSQIATERPFACDYLDCMMAFRKKRDLNRHKNTHIDRNSPEFYKKAFLCTYVVNGEPCFHTTFQKANMETHVLVHTGERPFGCRGNTCERTFNDRSARLKHEKKDHSIMPAKRGARVKPAPAIASASTTKTKTRDESKMSRGNRHTPYPIPSSSTSVPSAPSTSTAPIPSVPSAPTAPITSISSTSFGSETSTSLLTPGLSMFHKGAVEGTGLFTDLTIPPFNDTMAYPPNFSYGQDTWQQRKSFAPMHGVPIPFFVPAYPAAQPSIMPQPFWPQAGIALAPAYPQLGTAYDGLFFLDSMAHTSGIWKGSELVTPLTANDSEKSQLSQEDLDALSAYYSSLPPP